MLQSMGSQRVKQDWVTEQQQICVLIFLLLIDVSVCNIHKCVLNFHMHTNHPIIHAYIHICIIHTYNNLYQIYRLLDPLLEGLIQWVWGRPEILHF